MFPKEGEVCKCNIHKLKDRKNLLQKYIDANTDLEVQALYAVQALFLRLDRPQGKFLVLVLSTERRGEGSVGFIPMIRDSIFNYKTKRSGQQLNALLWLIPR